jgi:hypothetical protein
MTEDYSITKSTVECYKIRSTSIHNGWADITIDSKGTTGRIQIASDYGDWQYYWGACGMPFKEFLISLGKDYLAGKFGEDNYFDYNRTIRQYKKDILDYRKDETISAEAARDMWDELENLITYGEREFSVGLWVDCPKLMVFYDNTPTLHRTISPMFELFWNKLWLPFMDELKNEISTS